MAGLLIAVSSPFFPAGAVAQEPPTILVLNVKHVDQASPVMAAVLGDLVVKELQERRSHRVLTQSDASRTLSAEQLQQLPACANPGCIASVAGATGAVYAIDGSVGLVGSSSALLLTLVDVRQRVALSQKTAFVSGDRDQMLPAVRALVTELLTSIMPQPAAQPAVPASVPAPAPIMAPPSDPAAYVPVASPVPAPAAAPPAYTPVASPAPAPYVPLDYSKMQASAAPAADGAPLPTSSYAAAPADANALKPDGGLVTAKQAASPSSGMNNHRLWGHISFWSGLAIAGFGGVSTFMAKQAADDYQAGNNAADAEARNRTWGSLAVTGFAVGGVCMATGVLLWILDPVSAGRSQ